MSARLRFLLRAFRYRWRVDPGELHFLCKSLRPGQLAVDVGCHKGAYTYWMRRRVGPHGSVITFEPQPGQVEYLRKVLSGYDNIVLVPMALSDTQGRMPLYVGESTHEATLEIRDQKQETKSEANARTSQFAAASSHVEVTTLDRFFADRPQGPAFLKIDVEGHELAVLRGGVETLKRHRPVILVECETRHRANGDVRPVFELLTSLGYRGSFFVNRSRRPLVEFDPALHQRFDANSDRLPRGYANNFAFEHSSQA